MFWCAELSPRRVKDGWFSEDGHTDNGLRRARRGGGEEKRLVGLFLLGGSLVISDSIVDGFFPSEGFMALLKTVD